MLLLVWFTTQTYCAQRSVHYITVLKFQEMLKTFPFNLFYIVQTKLIEYKVHHLNYVKGI